ncbi:hypothetical protein CEXT_583131 [Caerostris extrusa]|uniref:Uncharacterized protein n=1 Tax=Caerostris extrusa TaxID=172846 RepID=A0AAV4VSU5_CAEEX|nr:hypothetical protein CEXT_583131 [Caerostris extrusa]
MENSSLNLGEEFAASLLKLIGTRVIFHSFILFMSKVPRRRKCRRCLLRVGQREFSCHLAICHVICGAKRSALPARPPNINLVCLQHWRDSKLLWKL